MSQLKRLDKKPARELTREDRGGGITVRKVWEDFGPGSPVNSPHYLVTLTYEEEPVAVWSTSWGPPNPTQPSPSTLEKRNRVRYVEATVKPVAQGQWKVAPEGAWVPEEQLGTFPTPEEALTSIIAFLRRWDATRRLTGAVQAFEADG